MTLRFRLFADDSCSPVTTDVTSSPSWKEIETVLTPCRSADDSVDSGIGSSVKLSIKLPSRKRCLSRTFIARKSLFSGKRPADADEAQSPLKKKSKSDDVITEAPSTDDIITAVERLESHDLIADGSRGYTLPTIPGKHSDLKSISADTMAEVLNGVYSDRLHKVTIVDCRYPYEFEGGHIRGAVNMYTRDAVNSLLETQTTAGKRHVLIFHCEFSSERGPRMYRHLRSQDRALNQDHYPKLNFPEVYLLHGGYKAFYESHGDLCDPDSYTPMLHLDHCADLRHFRVKSKTWTAGSEKVSSRRHRSRIFPSGLDF
ncbi:M-phase inducer phosphatase-like [Dreissena polymorpha]|uniref:M-phase inducer phosphatase-like n=1 Tax=Dreissena polymorpha TaxID=45954 RepID=UPI002263CA9F|nr:M-phase inducer phosphatase-like [Dreissena polymorpha]